MNNIVAMTILESIFTAIMSNIYAVRAKKPLKSLRVAKREREWFTLLKEKLPKQKIKIKGDV